MEITFTQDILDFICVETVEAIDFGILDLAHIKNYELKKSLMFVSELLELELKENYLTNTTGIFRVSYSGGIWKYQEMGCIIKAKSVIELKREVTLQNRIWYIFDEYLYENIRR